MTHLDECLWTQCIVIPEPPAESNLLYVPDGVHELLLLSDLSEYAPSVPVTLPAPYDFGTMQGERRKVLVVDARVGDDGVAFVMPVLTLRACFAGHDEIMDVLTFTVDATFGKLYIRSSLTVIILYLYLKSTF